jgi:hypothetical protein
MRTETAIAIIFLGVCVALGISEGVSRGMGMFPNQRGWIGCENGIMWAKNIDIAANTFDMPEGRYIFDIDGRYCRENYR